MSSPRILVLRAGAIGDFILTLPALRAVRTRFPSHRLVLAARADVLPLVHGTLADEVVAFDDERLAPLFAAGASLRGPIRDLLGAIDLAVLWLPDRSARILAANLRQLDVATCISANPLPTGRHAADHLLETLAPLGISAAGADTTPRLTLPAAQDRTVVRSWQAHVPASATLVALHPGSGSARKRWSARNFLALAARLAAAGDVHVLLLSGPAEDAADLALPPHTTHIHDASLVEIAVLLRTCRLYVGNDSGITHLAAAIGVPVIALFGPTDPSIWGPRGERVTMLQSPTDRMDDIRLDQVWQAVSQALSGDD